MKTLGNILWGAFTLLLLCYPPEGCKWWHYVAYYGFVMVEVIFLVLSNSNGNDRKRD